ncbi:MAG: hypothetical protein M3Y07_00450 [Acidobacteriota bacterium]|nr:hypothetical protein [Acidobacteriota bacterium]
MKTTIELPDILLRKAKAAAAERGVSLKDFFAEAVQEQLRRKSGGVPAEKPWMRAFGGLRDLHKETKRVEKVIEDEFERIDEEEWR